MPRCRRAGRNPKVRLPPLGRLDADRPQTHAETQILAISERTLNRPATAVQASQLLGGSISAAGGEAPGLLHVRILDADYGSYSVAIGGDLRATQHARASASLHPVGSGAGFTGAGSHGYVAAKANDVVEI